MSCTRGVRCTAWVFHVRGSVQVEEEGMCMYYAVYISVESGRTIIDVP